MLTAIGPSPAPSTAGVAVNFTGYLQQAVLANGVTTYSCTSWVDDKTTTDHLNSTASNYSVDLTLPAGGCRQGVCDTYTGPYEPISLSLGSLPSGYFLVNSGMDFGWVYALARVGLSTGTGPTYLSDGDQLQVTATPYAANWAVSPIPAYDLTYYWSLEGSANGWAINGSSMYTGGQEVSLTASSNAGSATLEVYATGLYDGIAETTAIATESLVAVPTQGGLISVQPASVDAGQPVSLTVLGTTGAPGYSYSATIFPQGNGKGGVAVPCSIESSSSSQVSLSCSTNVSYPNTGTASTSFSPTAVVSNGYSSSSTILSSSSVTVYPTLILSSPATNVYANTSFKIPVTVSGGTPGYRYCIRPAGVQWSCSPASGTLSQSYSFTTEYYTAGTYPIAVSVLDGSGINQTISVNASVWWPLALGPLVATPGVVDSGGSVILSSTLEQGGPPITIWWNDSTGASVCPSITALGDGPVACKFSPGWSGTGTVTITARDAAGGTQAKSTSVEVSLLPTSVLIVDRAGSNAGGSSVPLEDEIGILGYFNATFTGGAAPFSYQWAYDGTSMSLSTGSAPWSNVTYDWPTSGVFTVNFTATDNSGHETNGSVNVIVSARLSSVNAQAQYDSVDVGVMDNLSAHYSGGAPPYTFTWNTGDGHVTATSTGWYHYSWSSPQNYTVTLTIRDGVDVAVSSNFTVSVNTGLTVPCASLASPNPTEVGIPTTFSITCVAGGTQAYTYEWVFGDGSTSITSVPRVSHTYLSPSSFDTYVVITDAVGARVDSTGMVLPVSPRLTVSIPTTGSFPCSSSDNLNPIDVGVVENLCAAGSGGIGAYTYSWSAGTIGLGGSSVVFPYPGDYGMNVTVNDSLGAIAWAEASFTVVPPPRILLTPAVILLDVNQTACLRSEGFNGTGSPDNWSYSWSLNGSVVGSRSSLDYTFSPPLNQSRPGEYTFELAATDSTGGRAEATANVTLFRDPNVSLSVGPQAVDVGNPTNATVDYHGGQPPYLFAWAVLTPSGWLNITNNEGTLPLPTGSSGSYTVSVSVTDSSGYIAVALPQAYTVNPALRSSLWSSTQTLGNAVLVNGTVTLRECRLQGGTGPFWIGFNSSGTIVSEWSILSNGSFCASVNATYGLPGQVWAAGAVRDSTGEVSVNIQSFQALAPATPPSVPYGSRDVAVQASAYLSAAEASPYALVSWIVSDPRNLSAQTLPNGSLLVRPMKLGNYTVTAEARVTYGGFQIGAWAESNVTLEAVAGAASVLNVQVSDSNYSAVAGSDFFVSLMAYDAWGDPAIRFSENLTIQTTGPTVPSGMQTYINASSIPATISANGTWASIPAVAWRNGTLQLSLSQHFSGIETYFFRGTLCPSSWPGGVLNRSLNISWSPDLEHMRLFSPETVLLTPSENDTLWRISDQFGNGIAGGAVYVRGTWGSYSTSVSSPIEPGPYGSSVWVNITVYGTQGGTVNVMSMYGQALLPPIEIPPATSTYVAQEPTMLFSNLAAVLIVAVLVCSGLLLYFMLRRDRRSKVPAEVTEEDLERDSRVSDALLNAVKERGRAGMDQLGEAVREYHLSDDELSLYLARLVTSGRLSSHPGAADNKPIFEVSPQEGSTESADKKWPEEAVSVHIDEHALVEAQRRQSDLYRTAEKRAEGRDDAGPGDAEPASYADSETTEEGEA